MGFMPSRADQDLWIRKLDDYHGYDYVAIHVDDLINYAKVPSKYVSPIVQEFKIWDVTSSPGYCLGNDLKWRKNLLHVSSTKYTKETMTFGSNR